MSVNQIAGMTKYYNSNSSTKSKPTGTKAAEKSGKCEYEPAAVYDKSEEPVVDQKTYVVDTETIERMKEETERRTQSLRELVKKMMLKQGQTFDDSTDIYEILREGRLEVDPETRAQAQKDIAEDGYWGVNETSDRLVSFAKALTGGDPTKANEMIEAIKKGFKQAEKAWGGELPDICRNTMQSAIKKLEYWRDSLQKDDQNDASMEKETEDAIKNQASAGTVAE